MALAHENEVANLKAVAEGEKAQKALEDARKFAEQVPALR